MSRTDSPLVVVALGGNAIQSPEGDDSVTSDFVRTETTAKNLVALATSAGVRLVVSHGNGPQVGNHLLRSELGFQSGKLPALPLDVCVADTQGGMGYMIQQCLTNAFGEAGVPAVVTSIVTQVVVDAGDRAFENPSKPVGVMIPAENVPELEERGWTLRKDPHRGAYRRVVPSPDPKEIVEAGAIKALVDDGVIVIAVGGGGIPVVQAEDGSLRGVPAVVDKDLASALLARDLRADALLILTDVENVFAGFDTPRQRPLETVAVAEARALLDGGEFPAGSMGPKVEAVCRFVESTGGRGIITSIEASADALEGRTGTRVIP